MAIDFGTTSGGHILGKGFSSMKTGLTTSKALAVSAALLLLLTACGGKADTASTTTEEGKALTETVDEPLKQLVDLMLQ